VCVYVYIYAPPHTPVASEDGGGGAEG